MRRSPTRHSRGSRRSRLTTAVFVPVLIAACAAAAPPARPGTSPQGHDAQDFVDVEVATVAIDLGGGRPLALLHESWQRILPVWVGEEEALAIARARLGVPPSRPLTHDLFADVLAGLGGKLEEVLVYDLRDGLYRGLLRIRVDGELREFDTRPSDGLALAVRTGARIRVDPRLFETASGVDFISMQGERPIVRMRGIIVSSASAGVATEPDARSVAHGVTVLHAADPAASRGVLRGDVIQSVNGRVTDTPRRFVEAVQEIPDDAALRLSLVRGAQALEVRVPPATGAPKRS